MVRLALVPRRVRVPGLGVQMVFAVRRRGPGRRVQRLDHRDFARLAVQFAAASLVRGLGAATAAVLVLMLVNVVVVVVVVMVVVRRHLYRRRRGSR